MRFSTAIAAILIVIPFIATPGPALAKGPFGERGPGRHMEHFLEQEAEELGLDDETKATIRKLLEEGREQAREFDDALHEARSVVHDLLSQDVADEEAVMRQAEIIGQIETERSKHRLKTLMEIHALLTPEQRALLREKREQKRGRGHEAILDACAADIEALCPEAEPGHGRFRCMLSHREDVSAECRETMREQRRGGRGHGPGPFGP
jgi:Spy/CpxP family protein refolding chaperone